ncbi:PucR family transcriptional regulator [Bifidobacterium simiarum]|uniref:PucR family transcriptional regulator n=1 Tax=Bifidobacterium simiarum TaxID=2045441 RepID=UPI001BDD7533|nr:PucR family transcriptional regulator [Bifidobacterium simiarum]MBT1165905.1 PucR family transcriptional regulator [Bifidobacterium simiarum]
MSTTFTRNDDPAEGITLEQLLADQSLKLRLVCPGAEGALKRRISWVHPAEILDIAMWSEPGEVLLTTGANFPTEGMDAEDDHALLVNARKAVGLPARFSSASAAYRQWCDTYVAQLAQAGVVAIGFGVAVKHPTTPMALIDAANRAGLPLFEIPLEIPFTPISKAVSRALTDRHDDVMRQSSLLQRQVLKAAAGGDSVHDVIAITAKLVSGWAAYVDASGTVIDISNRTFGKQAQDWAMKLAAKAAEAQSNPGMTTLFGSEAGRDYCASVVRDSNGSHGRLVGIVVASAAQTDQIDMLLRSVTMVAADVMSVVVPQLKVSERHIRRLRSACIGAFAQGNGNAMLPMADELWPDIPQPPLRLICVDGETLAVDRLYTALDADPQSAVGARRILFGEYDHRLWLVVGADAAEAAEGTLLTMEDIDFGACDCSSWQSMEYRFPEAVQDLHLRRLNDSDRSFSDMSVHELIRPDLAVVYSRELLRPLYRLPKQETEALLATMRELLATSFNVGATAKRLDVHRHTVENRLNKIERLLGLDLGNEASRVRLWIACSFLRQ